MLLHPFEEQLDLPAFPVQIGNLDRAEGKVVREDKNQIPLTVQYEFGPGVLGQTHGDGGC